MRARELEAEGRITEAVDTLKSAVSSSAVMSATDAVLLHELARVKLNSGDLIAAERILKACFAFGFKGSQIRASYAESLLRQNKGFEEAHFYSVINAENVERLHVLNSWAANGMGYQDHSIMALDKATEI